MKKHFSGALTALLFISVSGSALAILPDAEPASEKPKVTEKKATGHKAKAKKSDDGNSREGKTITVVCKYSSTYISINEAGNKDNEREMDGGEKSFVIDTGKMTINGKPAYTEDNKICFNDQPERTGFKDEKCIDRVSLNMSGVSYIKGKGEAYIAASHHGTCSEQRFKF